MRFYWTSIRLIIPWTGTGAWTYWKDKACPPGKYGSSGRTGYGSPWWPRPEDTTPHPFKGFHIVMQGNPPLTIIFNVVIDSIMFHWATIVAAE